MSESPPRRLWRIQAEGHAAIDAAYDGVAEQVAVHLRMNATDDRLTPLGMARVLLTLPRILGRADRQAAVAIARSIGAAEEAATHGD